MMFKSGDWIWAVICGETLNLLLIAEVGGYYLCQEFTYDDDFNKNLDMMYKSVREFDNRIVNDITMVKKECVFATEEEAREVLEVMG